MNLDFEPDHGPTWKVTEPTIHHETPAVFQGFPKIARYSRLCTITEKIDGTNASIFISDDLGELSRGEGFYTASRTQWIIPEKDNAGFSRWAHEHKEELMKLGPGHHFGEWWGLGIQRKYGQDRKRFSLFNTFKWSDPLVRPACCDVVPVLYEGEFGDWGVAMAMESLRHYGSKAAPGFLKPEGIVIYHQAGKMYFKKTLLNDEKPKGSMEAA
jgi:hypothetical protein